MMVNPLFHYSPPHQHSIDHSSRANCCKVTEMMVYPQHSVIVKVRSIRGQRSREVR